MNIKEIDATWDRLTRNNLNDNFNELQTNITSLDKAKFNKGAMPPNTNYDTLLTPGNYYTGGTEIVDTSTGLAVKLPSSILVFGGGSVYTATQIQVVNTTSEHNFYIRFRVNSQKWSDWVPVGEDNKSWDRGELPENTNIYDMRGPEWVGVWNISGASTASTIQGELPPGLTQWLPGQIEVRGSGGGNTNLSTIMYTPYGLGGNHVKVLTITINNYKASGREAWSEWVDIAKKEEPVIVDNKIDVYKGHSGVPNTARIEAFKEKYPLVSTGGKGAVMFRYDHGLTNFKTEIKPLHDSYNLPYCIAMNSRTWDKEENNGATQTEVKQWIADGLCEIWNHTATHEDTDVPEELFDIIVNGKKELEQQLDTVIYGFIVPGMSPTGMGGFYGGSSYDVFSETYAGSLIQAFHAVSSGAFPGTAHRKLDGVIRQGQSHYTIEKRTVEEVKAQIDKAVRDKTAVQLMMHPRVLNLDGYISTGDLIEILNYVKTKVDSGELVALSPYQSLHAIL